MSMGYGSLHFHFSKQNMNAKSLTEVELIGTSEYVIINLWIVVFLEAQGYEIKKNIIFQDNQSTIWMGKNGRYCFMGNSRHINICQFFVKDRFEKGEIEVKYCPSNLTISRYFTTPLQEKMINFFMI